MRRLAAVFALPLLLAPLACPRAPHSGGDPGAPCASLDDGACKRARALTIAASTYADEQHDYVLASRALSGGAALARTKDGWRTLPLGCARPQVTRPRLDLTAVDYAFIGFVVDGTLVSADADIGPLLARAEPRMHDVGLVALAFVHDAAPPAFDAGKSLLETPSGGCSCGAATHFAGATKYGATLTYRLHVPRRDTHVRALDFMRGALEDTRGAVVRESREGALVVDGLEERLAGRVTGPLTFHVLEAVPVAYAARPLAELCDFPAPEVSPSPLDFGIAPYGTEARRAVHVFNRASTDLRAILGADTFVLPARGAINLPLRWTPDGDAPGCETQTRDEVIPFFRAGDAVAPVPRVARVLETVRTGRPSAEHTEHIDVAGPHPAYATTARDWTCPRDFVRTSCRAESPACADGHGCTSAGYAVTAEPRGENGCHFACSGPQAGAPPPFCRFDAVIECALHCGP